MMQDEESYVENLDAYPEDAFQELQAQYAQVSDTYAYEKSSHEETKSQLVDMERENQMLRQRLRDSASAQTSLKMKVQHLQGRVAAGTSSSTTSLPPVNARAARPASAPYRPSPGPSNLSPPRAGSARPGSAVPPGGELSAGSLGPPSSQPPAAASRPPSGRAPPAAPASGRVEQSLPYRRPVSARPTSAHRRKTGESPAEIELAGKMATGAQSGVPGEDWHEAPGRQGTATAAPAAGHKPYAVDVAIQVAPTPWTRFYFRKDLSQVKPKGGNSLYQHFDVQEIPKLQAGEFASTNYVLEEVVPQWLPDSYDRLYYSRHAPGEKGDMIKVHVNDKSSKNMLKGMKVYSKERRETLKVTEFATYIARLLPRSSNDYENLRELQSGLLLYIVNQVVEGKDAMLAQMRAELQADFERSLTELRDQLTAELAAEQSEGKRKEKMQGALTKMQRAVNSSWQTRKGMEMDQLGQQMEALHEQIKQLQQELEERDGKIDDLKGEVKDKDAEIARLLDLLENLKAERAAEQEAHRAALEELTEERNKLTAALEDTKNQLAQTQVEYEEYRRSAEQWMEEQKARAAEMQRTFEAQLEELRKDLNQTKLVNQWKQTQKDLRNVANQEEIANLNEGMENLQENLTKVQTTGRFKEAGLRGNVSKLKDGLEQMKEESEKKLRDLEEEHAAKEEELKAASEEERARLEAEMAAARAAADAELAAKDKAMSDMSAMLQALEDRVKQAEAAEQAALQARLQMESQMPTEGPIAVRERSKFGDNYLETLFGPTGPLARQMDNGRFVSVCHDFMAFMADRYGAECMVAALEYDPDYDDDQVDDPETYDDNILKVVVTSPGLSPQALSLFADAGTILPQDPATSQYKAVNSGEVQEYVDEGTEMKVLVVPLMLPDSPSMLADAAKGAKPSYGTLTVLIPKELYGGVDKEMEWMKCLRDAKEHQQFSGKQGLATAAHKLQQWEGSVVERMRTVVSESPDSAASLQMAKGVKNKWRDVVNNKFYMLLGVKKELEAALLRSTLASALSELKRYRHPTDTVVGVLLGVLLIVRDPHLLQFISHVEFALGPTGHNELLSIWMVARTKLISGSKRGSLVSEMRKVYSDDGKSVADHVTEFHNTPPEEQLLVEDTRKAVHMILDKFSDAACKKASQVLYVMREWMAIWSNLHDVIHKNAVAALNAAAEETLSGAPTAAVVPEKTQVPTAPAAEAGDRSDSPALAPSATGAAP